MGQRLIPIVILLAILALATAAASMALAVHVPGLWQAAVALSVLGGITPLIYAVNARVVPVFSRRSWPSTRPITGALVLSVAGAWLVFLGRGTGYQIIELVGSGAALAGGILFVASIMILFRSPAASSPAPPLPFPEQREIDRLATRFTRLASIYLLAGLTIGFVTTVWMPDRGRWDLVWAHTMLVGWFLTMASGICYHVLSRWTGERWRNPAMIRLHLYLVTFGLPLMLLALALDAYGLFAVAGPLQAIALILFIWNVLPLVLRLSFPSRLGVASAAGFLVIGVSIGIAFAVAPEAHAGLRFTHAQINLFGWTTLLICGVGYYLFPRLVGQPLRWPRLAMGQLVLQIIGVSLSATAWWWHLGVERSAPELVTASGLLMSLAIMTFAFVMGMTFHGASNRTATRATLQPRQPLPMR